jgi:hypothetical protein
MYTEVSLTGGLKPVRSPCMTPANTASNCRKGLGETVARNRFYEGTVNSEK